MDEQQFDIIICGGGPGGSTCAMGFADTNLKIAVIEKSSFPREKVCGEGMAPYIPKALNRIDPRFKKAFDEFRKKTPVNFIRLVAFNHKSVQLKFKEPWFISSRYHFDNFLYEQASSLPNVSYFTNEQVKEIKISNEEVCVVTNSNKKLKAKLIVGCDGATSIVRRQLTDYKPNKEFQFAAVRAYFSNVENIQPDQFEFHFIPKYPDGYLWIFPSENGNANVGIGNTSMNISEHHLNLREILNETIQNQPELKGRFKNATLIGEIKGWSIPLGYQTHPVSGNRFMLVGDAASVADPFSGEGIGQAVVTGRIAAEFARKCFEENNFSDEFMKGYDREVDLKWGKLIRKRKKLADRISRNPRFLNRIIFLLQSKGFIHKIITAFLMKLTN